MKTLHLNTPCKGVPDLVTTHLRVSFDNGQYSNRRELGAFLALRVVHAFKDVERATIS